MFDNLRESASSSSFYEEESNELYKEPAPTPAASVTRRANSRFLGMTALQRFIVSLMFMFTVCILGLLALFTLGRMSLF